MRPLNLIVSCSENRVIGRNGGMPWRIPEDQDFFHAKTAGQIVVLGRICFDTWPQAVTDGRRAVVVTHTPLTLGQGRTGGVGTRRPTSADSLEKALALAEGLPGEIFICGGQRVYEETLDLPQASRLYLTLVHAEVPGDRFFPDWRKAFPREVARRDSADAKWRYSFLTLER